MKINKNKIKFVNLVVDFIKKNYFNKINKIVIFGDSANSTITNPESFDVAIGFINDNDTNNYEILGDILSYMGEIVDEGDCTLTPISEKLINKSYLTMIKSGVVVYEKKD